MILFKHDCSECKTERTRNQRLIFSCLDCGNTTIDQDMYWHCTSCKSKKIKREHIFICPKCTTKIDKIINSEKEIIKKQEEQERKKLVQKELDLALKKDGSRICPTDNIIMNKVKIFNFIADLCPICNALLLDEEHFNLIINETEEKEYNKGYSDGESHEKYFGIRQASFYY